MSKFPADFNGFTTSNDRMYYDPPAVNPEDLERKKFERWLDNNSYNKQRDQKGVYQSSFCQIAWAGWMARARQEGA